MDRNSIVGFTLIALILIGYTYFTAPTEAEKQKYQRTRDSIAQVELLKQQEVEQVISEKGTSASNQNTEVVSSIQEEIASLPDSAKTKKLNDAFGDFGEAALGNDENIVLENDKIILTLSNKGGKPVSVELKEYKTYSGEPLTLFDKDSSKFNFNFFYQNRLINTDELYFESSETSVSITGDQDKSVSLKLFAGSPNKYIEFIYGLKGNDYMIDFDVKLVGLEEVLVKNNNELAFNWNLKAPSKEKGKEPQYAATTVFYKYVDDEVDYISETSDDKQELEASTKWVSFKQQFFSASVIADKSFDKVNGMLETKKLEGSKKYTKFLAADLTLVFERELDPSFGMQFYFGPNHYQTLDAYNLKLEEQIDLGWGIFGWVNEYLIIEVFNFLDGFNLNYGIIILLLTVFIKMLLSPLTYKNYLSSAKTRVLKPEIDELNAKFRDGDAMKKQQATMSLYRQAGVNPMAGCVPMILQFPILIAMYRFFPASIELRQESFLWADDLSSYDSIFDLGFSIPFYGDHVSLFTILMAISTMLYTKYNSQTASMGGGMQAQQMKIMMYIMPIFFLGFFNNFSAGLSYYYFLANVISMVQQWVIKKFFIDEDAIHRKIQENKKKPKAQKKSKFQQRLEDMAKQRGYNPPKK
jgi:YidC/Oxa1 family membrane protein insertase